MSTWLEILQAKGDEGLAEVRRALSLLEPPLTEAKRELARQRLQRGVEGLAIVWRELGEIPADAPFTPPPTAAAPKGGVVEPPEVVSLHQARSAR